MRFKGLACAAGLVLALAGCGGSDNDATASGGGATASGGASSISTASATPPSDSTPTGDASGGATVSAADFCAFLREERPKLAGAGSPVEALATFTVDTATFWESKAPIETLGAANLDGLATGECPDVRTAVLKAIGVSSFDEV